jgi:hypothetical protein
MRDVPFRFECWPFRPVTPPPCRRCGSVTDDYTSGLCARCHPEAPSERTPTRLLPGHAVPVVQGDDHHTRRPVAGAYRYTTMIDHPAIDDPGTGTGTK